MAGLTQALITNRVKFGNQKKEVYMIDCKFELNGGQ